MLCYVWSGKQTGLIVRRFFVVILVVFIAVSSHASDTSSLFNIGASSASRDYDWSSINRSVSPGYGDVVDTVLVEGNRHTKSFVITREMATKPGSPLSEDLLRRDYSYLKWMGFFSKVGFEIQKDGKGHCKLIVRVIERPDLFMKYPYPIVNYDFKKGVSYGVNWKIKNFRGVGEEIGASFLQRRDIEEWGSAYWTVPWFFANRIRFSFQMNFYKRIEFPQLIEYIREREYPTISIGIPLSRSLVKQIWLRSILAWERRVSMQRLEIDNSFRFYTQQFIRSGISAYYDSRDNGLSPWRGMLGMVGADVYATVRGVDQDYIFYYMKYDLFVPLSKRTTFMFALDGIVNEGRVPYYFKMGLGGSSDLRGYVNADLKGDTKFLQTFQLKTRLFGPIILRLPAIGEFDATLNAVAFIDNGALMDCVSDIVSSQYYTTGGIGLELLSPLRDRVRFELAGGEGGNLIFSVTSSSRF